MESGGFSPFHGLSHFPQGFALSHSCSSDSVSSLHIQGFMQSHSKVMLFVFILFVCGGDPRAPPQTMDIQPLFNFSSQHVGWRTDTRRGSRQGTGMGGGGSKTSVIQRDLPSHWKFSRFQDLLKHSGTSFPTRRCCQNCGSAAPKRQEENPAGRRGRVQGGQDTTQPLHSPLSPTLGGQKGGTWSHLPHGIPMAMKWGARPESCRGAQRGGRDPEPNPASSHMKPH